MCIKRKLVLVFFILFLLCFPAGCSSSGDTASGAVTTPASAQAETKFQIDTTGTDTKTGLNQYLADNFRTEDRFVQYYENGICMTVQGIDVSAYNGDIDWEKVKNSGIDFAMIRVGGRGYGESGVLYTDEKALSNIQNAKAAGLKTGAYFFSQAITPEEAKEEANYCMDLLKGISLDMPLAYDWEEIKEDSARTDNLSDETLTLCARTFCEQVETGGYTPMIYAKTENVYRRYDLKRLSGQDFWIAEYACPPSVLEGYRMWQYSESAVIDGISGTVDLNLYFTYK